MILQHAEPSRADVEPLTTALLGELRGRFLNPAWLKPLMEHGYVQCAPSSAAAVAQLVESRIVIPVVVGSSPISRPVLSRAPLLYSDAMVRWFAGMMSLRTAGQKLQHFLKLRPAMLLTPVIGLMKGLTDPVVGLLMGQTAENLAWKFGISRQLGRMLTDPSEFIRNHHAPRWSQPCHQRSRRPSSADPQRKSRCGQDCRYRRVRQP